MRTIKAIAAMLAVALAFVVPTALMTKPEQAPTFRYRDSCNA